MVKRGGGRGEGGWGGGRRWRLGTAVCGEAGVYAKRGEGGRVGVGVGRGVVGWGLVGLGACRVGVVGGNVHGMGELWGWGLVGWGLWWEMVMECSWNVHLSSTRPSHQL